MSEGISTFNRHSMQSSLAKPQEQKSDLVRLKCPHCGINQSSRGKPFTLISLQHHISKRHPAVMDAKTKPDNVLTCEICSCWKSSRGTPFMTEAELSNHRRQAHRASTSAAPNQSSQSHVTNVQAKSKPRQQVMSVPVKFCPQCGCNVEVIAAALSIFS